MIYNQTAETKYADDEELDALRAMRDQIVNMRDAAHKWADNPTSPQGALELAAYEDSKDRLWAIRDNYDCIDHREVFRVVGECGFLGSFRNRLRQGKADTSFQEGRMVERLLNYLDRMVEEREQIVEYAEARSDCDHREQQT